MVNKIKHERRAAILKLNQEGKSAAEIGRILGVTQQSVSSMEDRMGLPKRKKGFPPCPEKWRRNYEIYDRVQKGERIAKLAQEFGLFPNYVYQIIGLVRDKKKSGKVYPPK